MFDINLISEMRTGLALPWYNVLLVPALSAIVAIFIYLDYSPKLRIRIIPTWVNENLVKIRLEMENHSKVVILFPGNHKEAKVLKVIAIKKSNLTDDDKADYIDFKNGPCIFVCKKTERLYPGEKVSVERLESCATDSFLKIGFQVKTKLRFFGSLANKFQSTQEQWTTIRFLTRKEDQIPIVHSPTDDKTATVPP